MQFDYLYTFLDALLEVNEITLKSSKKKSGQRSIILCPFIKYAYMFMKNMNIILQG